jgi:hypothetical protein
MGRVRRYARVASTVVSGSDGRPAGAGSVMQHVVAHGGNTEPPLFLGAMTSSTFLPFQYAFNDPIPEASSQYHVCLQLVAQFP